MKNTLEILVDKIIKLQYPYLEQMHSATRQSIEKDREKMIDMIKKFITEEKPNL